VLRFYHLVPFVNYGRFPNAIYFGDQSRRSLRELNVNLKQNVKVFELHATFAERMATKVDGIGRLPIISAR